MKTSLSAIHSLPIDPFPRVQAVCFDSIPQARHWLDDLVAGEDFSTDHQTLVLSSGMKIHSMHLDAILICKDRAGIDERYHRQNQQFRRGHWHDRSKVAAEPQPDKAPKPVKPERPKKPEGLITVAQIAAQLKVKPFDIRQALRNSGAIKPAFGWAFSPTEVEAVKKLLS